MIAAVAEWRHAPTFRVRSLVRRRCTGQAGEDQRDPLDSSLASPSPHERTVTGGETVPTNRDGPH